MVFSGEMQSYLYCGSLVFQTASITVNQYESHLYISEYHLSVQAIAAAACIHNVWPVLVITPSLRLQWASVSTSMPLCQWYQTQFKFAKWNFFLTLAINKLFSCS